MAYSRQVRRIAAGKRVGVERLKLATGELEWKRGQICAMLWLEIVGEFCNNKGEESRRQRESHKIYTG